MVKLELLWKIQIKFENREMCPKNSTKAISGHGRTSLHTVKGPVLWVARYPLCAAQQDGLSLSPNGQTTKDGPQESWLLCITRFKMV